MSTYGFRVKNDAGGWVVASDGFGLNYLGKASLVGYEMATDPNGLYGGATRPQWMRYRITTPSPVVMPFLPLSTFCCGIASVTQAGSQWDFVIYNQDASNNPVALDVHCFGRPTTHSPWGMRIRQADGVTLAYEFGMNRPLMFAGVVDLAAGVSSVAIPSGIVKPAILGFGLGFVDPAWSLVNASRGQWRANAYVQGWSLSGTVLRRAERAARTDGDLYEFGPGENPGSEDFRGLAVTAFLIDANGL
ncbi:hypothetical protein OU995_21220 [Roseateles sp. SL47]|uniref:hypothetical protein n=1 Tax=Roseateles sp. SL47 TaxID=2995138 RepID=UPI002270C85D|nr:hypothetical protein [Roseateles sp. SL47]WAC72067.1 hypothetical protein OU995_21220 [Roseateles sp. SL47]